MTLWGRSRNRRCFGHEEASIGLAMLGARREGAFAVQADVRKKVLWGQWAECALAGARNRRGRETLPQTMATTRGQLLLLPTASSNLDSGGLVRGVGALGRWALVHARSQCVTARRVPVTGATSPRTELFLVPQSTSITDLHPRPLPPGRHKHRRRGSA